METENKQLKIAGGFSLTELLTVVAVMTILFGLGVPTAKQIVDSFQSSAGLHNVISAALGNARAIAATGLQHCVFFFVAHELGPVERSDCPKEDRIRTPVRTGVTCVRAEVAYRCTGRGEMLFRDVAAAVRGCTRRAVWKTHVYSSCSVCSRADCSC